MLGPTHAAKDSHAERTVRAFTRTAFLLALAGCAAEWTFPSESADGSEPPAGDPQSSDAPTPPNATAPTGTSTDAATAASPEGGAPRDSGLRDGSGTRVEGGAAGGDSNPGPPRVQLIGRFTDDASPTFGWGGSAMRARFNGTAARITLEELTHISNPQTNGNHFDVFIDNKAPTLLVGKSGRNTYTLATDLPAGVHTVLVRKRTEGWVGDTRFHGFDFGAGQLQALPTVERRMLIVGDSISAGAAMEGRPCVPSPSVNASRSYGVVTATNLNADPMLIAWSGGTVMGSTGGGVLPTLYSRTLPQDSRSVWDASKWIPQVVVINLGTNDIDKNPTAAQFEDPYTKFLTTLRGQFPSAHVFCAVGPMLDGSQLTTIRKYVQGVVNKANAPQVHFIEFPTENYSTGTGCDGAHPNAQTHQQMADKLTQAIKSALGW